MELKQFDSLLKENNAISYTLLKKHRLLKHRTRQLGLEHKLMIIKVDNLSTITYNKKEAYCGNYMLLT